MDHDPESHACHEIAARDDSSTDPAPPQPGGPCTTDSPDDAAGAADRPHPASHDPYQPL